MSQSSRDLATARRIGRSNAQPAIDLLAAKNPDPRSDLDRAVEDLVTQHTCGAVIAAAWAAAHRLFRPNSAA